MESIFLLIRNNNLIVFNNQIIMLVIRIILSVKYAIRGFIKEK